MQVMTVHATCAQTLRWRGWDSDMACTWSGDVAADDTALTKAHRLGSKLDLGHLIVIETKREREGAGPTWKMQPREVPVQEDASNGGYGKSSNGGAVGFCETGNGGARHDSSGRIG